MSPHKGNELRVVMITGVGGYLGGCMAHHILASSKGTKVIGVDNLSRANKRSIEALEELYGERFGFYKLDLRHERERMREIMEEHGVDAVIHFAALALVGESLKKPEEYYDNNVNGTKNLLNAVVSASRIPVVVYSSSAAVYGIPQKLPIKEDSPLKPINPYGVTKVIGEQLLRMYRMTHGLRYVALRYFNPAGAIPPIGELHEPETHLIPRVVDSVISGKPIYVYGNDYPTEDGTPIRDFIHVKDLVEAHRVAMKALEKGDIEEGEFNVGTGKGHTVLQVIRVAEKVLGKEAKITFTQRREGDPPILIADPSSFEDTFGFKATSSLEEMIVSHYEFITSTKSKG